MEKQRLDTSLSTTTTGSKDVEGTGSIMNEKNVGGDRIRDDEDTREMIFFSPIQSHGQPLSKPRTLQSTKSHRSYGGEDGYSCHQGSIDDEMGNQSDEERRFEVRWDGDNDPMNPRSRSKFRKWIVVLILAGSALCVYVIAKIRMKNSDAD
jgi:hypothetical protein